MILKVEIYKFKFKACIKYFNILKLQKFKQSLKYFLNYSIFTTKY